MCHQNQKGSTPNRVCKSFQAFNLAAHSRMLASVGASWSPISDWLQALASLHWVGMASDQHWHASFGPEMSSFFRGVPGSYKAPDTSNTQTISMSGVSLFECACVLAMYFLAGAKILVLAQCRAVHPRRRHCPRQNPSSTHPDRPHRSTHQGTVEAVSSGTRPRQSS